MERFYLGLLGYPLPHIKRMQTHSEEFMETKEFSEDSFFFFVNQVELP